MLQRKIFMTSQSKQEHQDVNTGTRFRVYRVQKMLFASSISFNHKFIDPARKKTIFFSRERETAGEKEFQVSYSLLIIHYRHRAK